MGVSASLKYRAAVLDKKQNIDDQLKGRRSTYLQRY